jgi:RHS repeat-associated protein
LYEAYGNIVLSTGSSQNNRLANTKERDFSIGLDNYGFRYYDPEVGRYVSPDPVGSGIPEYVYVHNNPINFIDPLGLETDDPILDKARQTTRFRELAKQWLRWRRAYNKEAAAVHNNSFFLSGRQQAAKMKAIYDKYVPRMTKAQAGMVRIIEDIEIRHLIDSGATPLEAAVVHQGGAGLKNIYEATGQIDIYGRTQTTKERIRKGFFGIIELASTVLPAGKTGANLIAKGRSKLSEIAAKTAAQGEVRAAGAGAGNVGGRQSLRAVSKGGLTPQQRATLETEGKVEVKMGQMNPEQFRGLAAEYTIAENGEKIIIMKGGARSVKPPPGYRQVAHNHPGDIVGTASKTDKANMRPDRGKNMTTGRTELVIGDEADSLVTKTPGGRVVEQSTK